MERKNILSSQKETVKAWKDGFVANPSDEGIYYINKGYFPTAEDYCALVGIDYQTVKRFGTVEYYMYYNCVDNLYILRCETIINNEMRESLSVEYEDDTDWLGLFEEHKTEIGKAQWLPSNWKELITDEQLHDILQERNIQTIECLQDDDVPDEMKERIARDWCKDNSGELIDYLDESDKEEIADEYLDNNAYDIIDKAYDKLGDYERREFIKDCIDNL